MSPDPGEPDPGLPDPGVRGLPGADGDHPPVCGTPDYRPHRVTDRTVSVPRGGHVL